MIGETMKQVIKRIARSVLQLPQTASIYCLCKWQGIGWDRTWVFRGRPVIYKVAEAGIRIGRNVAFVSHPRFNSWGVIQPVVIMATGKGAEIVIGDDTGLSGCTITAVNRIEIGKEVLIGSGVVICDNDAHPLRPENRRHGRDIDSRPVIIGDGAFLGARSIVLKGVTIGPYAVVGAGSVVTRDVPPYAVVAGNPAKYIRDCRSS